MKFDFGKPDADEVLASEAPRVGDVYQAKGGRGPRLHIIIAQKGLSSLFVGVDREGQICSVGDYYTSVFYGRKRLGRVEGLDDLCFDVHWDGE